MVLELAGSLRKLTVPIIEDNLAAVGSNSEPWVVPNKEPLSPLNPLVCCDSRLTVGLG